MSERELNHFSNEGHLLSAATNIIISDSIKLLFFSLNWLSFIEQHGVWCNNTEFSRISLHNLELYSFETSSYKECVSFLNRSVAVLEIWHQESLGKITCDTLDGVI